MGTDKNSEHFFCPECGRELRIMHTAENTEKGGFDVLAHCEGCLRDWKWYRDPEGQSHELQRHFWG